jgi:ribose/xylose/arabinose/galactoside ABC-type transport system permease subunit
MKTKYLPLIATVLIFLIAYTICVVQYPNMLSTRVIGNLLTDNAFLGIAAVGMTFVILSGGIDLSIGSVIAFTGVLIAVLLRDTGIHPLFAFAIALVISTAFGAYMGAIIHYLEMPAFIVTLAGMFLARGACYLLTSDSIPVNHPFYKTLKSLYWKVPGGGRLTLIGGVMLLVFIVGIVIAHRTRFGTNVYALGGGIQTSKLMGVPVGRTTVQIYALSGFLAGLAGIVFSLYTSAGYSLATVGVELDAIAAVVIGGTLLTGGYGSAIGTVFGALTLGITKQGINFAGIGSDWYQAFLGVLLLSAVLVNNWVRTRAAQVRH